MEGFSLVFFAPAIKINFYIKYFKKYFAGRRIFIAREMTKIHETFYRFNLDKFSGFKENLKGELTVVISGKSEKKQTASLQQYEHSEFGKVEIKDIPRIKRIAAPHLVNSWKNIPHVTNHDEADITEMEEFRNSLKDIYTGEKKKITPLAFIIKALVSSMKKFPNFNSSI